MSKISLGDTRKLENSELILSVCNAFHLITIYVETYHTSNKSLEEQGECRQQVKLYAISPQREGYKILLSLFLVGPVRLFFVSGI